MNDTYLCHHGIKGQKWGLRRFQNEDGTLTEEGVNRYAISKNPRKQVSKDLNSDTKELLSKKKNAIKSLDKKAIDYKDRKKKINDNFNKEYMENYNSATEILAQTTSKGKHIAIATLAGISGMAIATLGNLAAQNSKSYMELGEAFVVSAAGGALLGVSMTNIFREGQRKQGQKSLDSKKNNK